MCTFYHVTSLLPLPIRYVHVFVRNGTDAVSDVGALVASCDDCGPCGLRTVLTTQLTGGSFYWYVVAC